jgi:glycine oxidase
MSSDVLIIGGGVIGLSIARELYKRNVGSVTVIERVSVGSEASWAAAGMLAPQAEADHIDDFFLFCAESRNLYPEFADELRNETGIDIELDRSGTLYLAFTDPDVTEIRRRFEWQRSAGLNVESLSTAECLSLEPTVSAKVREGLFFANDWQVENRKLLAALVEFAHRNKIKIVENTAIGSLITSRGKITGAETAHGRAFSADTVILATGAWTSLIKIGETSIPVEVKPIRGQMICFKQPERQLERVIYSPRGYIVPRTNGRVLAGATVEDTGFDKTTTDEGVNSLRASALEILPCVGKLRIAEKWAGLRPFAAGGLPVLGKLSQVENLIVATAHYRNGILLAPLTARIIAEAITGGRNSEYLSLFGPLSPRAVGKKI